MTPAELDILVEAENRLSAPADGASPTMDAGPAQGFGSLAALARKGR